MTYYWLRSVTESFLLSPIFHPHSKEWPSLTLLYLLNIYKTYPLISILIVIGYTLSYSHGNFVINSSAHLHHHPFKTFIYIVPTQSFQNYATFKILSIPPINKRIKVKFLAYCFRKHLENTVFWVLLVRRDIMDWPPTTLNMVVI